LFTRIAVAFDESPESQRAFQSALKLARLSGAEVYLFTVIESLPVYVSYVQAVAPDVPLLLLNERQAFYSDLHKRATQAAEKEGIHIHSKLVEGPEIKALLGLIHELHPDLLVVGLRFEPGGINSLLGGTAHQLALHAKCNILGIR
jgi:nucleotide-binding universal stress UspA family protein